MFRYLSRQLGDNQKDKFLIDNLISRLNLIEEKLSLDVGEIEKFNRDDRDTNDKLVDLVTEIGVISKQYAAELAKYVEALQKISEAQLKKQEQREVADASVVEAIRSNLTVLAKKLNNNKKILFLAKNKDLLFDDIPPYQKFTDTLSSLKLTYFNPQASAKVGIKNFCRDVMRMVESVHSVGIPLIRELEGAHERKLPDMYALQLQREKKAIALPWGNVLETAFLALTKIITFLSEEKRESAINKLVALFRDLMASVPPHLECLVAYVNFRDGAIPHELHDFILKLNLKQFLFDFNAFYMAILDLFIDDYPYVYLSAFPVDPDKLAFNDRDAAKADPILLERMPLILRYVGNDDIDWLRFNYLQGNGLKIPASLKYNKPLFI
jgi:hypothetical protein